MHALRREWSLLISYGTAAIFFFFQQQMLEKMESPLWATLAFVWLFAVMLMSAFAVVRHSEIVASIVGDALCVAAGWLRIHWPGVLLFMAAGRMLRYIAVALIASAV